MCIAPVQWFEFAGTGDCTYVSSTRMFNVVSCNRAARPLHQFPSHRLGNSENIDVGFATVRVRTWGHRDHYDVNMQRVDFTRVRYETVGFLRNPVSLATATTTVI
jgi:hypothetical protein